MTFDLLDPNRKIKVYFEKHNKKLNKKVNIKPVLKHFDNISEEICISLIDALDILLKSINIDEANVIIKTHHYDLAPRA